jgi:OFA family oxalate/formate antiporter-like MFS transporter
VEALGGRVLAARKIRCSRDGVCNRRARKRRTMSDVPVPGARRWLVLAAATGLMMCVGTAYSWSLYTRPLMAFFGWSSLQVSFAFALMVSALGLGALLGGVLHDRFGARIVGVAGAILWGLGFVLAGLGMDRFGLPWLYVTYGVISGCGAGMAYVVPGACVTRWFPHNRGLANGIVLFGFGAGSLIYNTIIAATPAFAHASDLANRVITARNAALQAGTSMAVTIRQDHAGIAAVAGVFVASGLILLVLGVLCALGLAPAPESAARKAERVHEYPPSEMLRTPTFYVIWGLVFVDCFAGLALIGNGVPIYSQLTGATATTAAATFGVLSIFNGIGRLAWAGISDVIGRIASFVAAFALEAASIFGLSFAHSSLTVSLALAVMMLCFGGVLAIAPAVMADYYGTRYFGEDYGYVITAASVSGLVGPLLFSVVEDATGSVTRTIVPIAVVVLAGALLPLAAKRPQARKSPSVSTA